MKRYGTWLLLLLITAAQQAFSQENERTEGYIRNAVPPFDNETGKVDWSKIEAMPIRVYKPAPGFVPAQNRHGDSNNILSVTDNADVQVFPSSNSQHEQHISVSKINPNNLLLSSNTPFYQGYYVSQNGGATWFGSDNMPDGIGTSGDPTTAFNADGHLFMETIFGSGYKSYRSTTQGSSWLTPVTHSYSPASFDKEMAAIDNQPGSPYLNNIYTAWTDFSGTYKVLFNRSTNGGASFGSNINIQNSWGQGTNVQTGVNGEVFVCWANYGTGNLPANGIGFARSTDGGVTFTNLTPVFPYVGIRTSNGPNSLFNNTRVNDFPSMAVDKSCGPFRGRIYIAYAGQQNGTGKAVIYLRYSINNGTAWSDAVEVNISEGRQNWFPWVATDDATGTVSVSYLSLDQPTGFITNTYLAYSFDGGFSWNNIKVSDVGHTHAAIAGFASGYCGDYIGNTAWGNKNYVVWNDNRNGQWQNYVSRVDFSQFALYSSNTDLNLYGPLTLSLPAATQVLYRATGILNSPSSGGMTLEPGTNVTMISGSRCVLTPGFIAKAGSHFQAFISNVSSCVNAIHRDQVSDDIEEHLKFLKPAFTGNTSDHFQVYPNPAHHEITFEYLLTDFEEVTLRILDLNGKEMVVALDKIKQQPGRNRFIYNLDELPNGTYLYEFQTASQHQGGKFIKAN